MVDIFLEKDDNRRENADDEENGRENVDEEDGNEVRSGDNAARGMGDEHDCEEVVDEDEVCDSERTPQNSDDEDCEQRFGRYESGSGEIKLGQAFDSIPHLKEVVVEYALKEKVNIKYTRWGSEKSEVRCSLGGDCKFRIYCSIQKRVGKFVVMTCNDQQSCIPNGYSKVLKDGVIAKLLLDDIRKYSTTKPKAIQETIEDRYNLVVTNDQCRKVKAKALSAIEDEHEEQFARLKDYRLELIE